MTDLSTNPTFQSRWVTKPPTDLGELCSDRDCRNAATIKADQFSPWVCHSHYVELLEIQNANLQTTIGELRERLLWWNERFCCRVHADVSHLKPDCEAYT